MALLLFKIVSEAGSSICKVFLGTTCTDGIIGTPNSSLTRFVNLIKEGHKYFFVTTWTLA